MFKWSQNINPCNCNGTKQTLGTSNDLVYSDIVINKNNKKQHTIDARSQKGNKTKGY